MKSKKFIICVLMCMAILFTGCSGNTETKEAGETDAAVEKLMTFTNYIVGEDKCAFQYLESNDSAEKWQVHYFSDNRIIVTIKDEKVVECCEKIFGEDSFSEDAISADGFTYDLLNQEARVYVDSDMADGHLTLYNYKLGDDKGTVHVDGEEYDASDDLDKLMRENGYVELVKSDIASFESDLAEHKLSIDDIEKLDYKSLVSEYKNSKILFEETKETEAITENKLYEIGTPIQYEWSNYEGEGLVNITLNRVCSYECSQESVIEGNSNEGKRMLYIDYTIENIGDGLWDATLNGIENLWADGKSCELQPLIFYTYLGDADMYGFYHEEGSDELRTGGKDEYYVVYKVDTEQCESIELELDDGSILLLKQGADSCIESAGESTISTSNDELSKVSEDSDKTSNDSDFDAKWYRIYNYFVMTEGSNTIEFITYDSVDLVDIAINGVTVDDFTPANYNYDEQWKAYLYTTSNGMTLGYCPKDRKILILSGDYTGEYYTAE